MKKHLGKKPPKDEELKEREHYRAVILETIEELERLHKVWEAIEVWSRYNLKEYLA